MSLLGASVGPAGDVVTVEMAAGPVRFHALWLRDNARDEASRHGDNDQRLFDVTELADEVSAMSAEVVDGRLVVAFGPDGVTSVYDEVWLEANRYDGSVTTSSGRPVSWGAADLSVQRLPWTDRQDLEAWQAITRALVRDGLAIVDGLAVGNDAEGPGATGTGADIVDVANLWGPVRETNYGEIFHVRAEANPTNLAFTPRALNVHTDNPYRRPVPGYQLLHCLVASDVGGVTVLVDGFRAAELLRDEEPGAFELLSTRSVPFRWSGDGFDLRNRGPLIEVEEGGPEAGAVRAVRYNNRSAAPFDQPFDEMTAFYEAFRTFAQMLHREDLEYRFTLAPGECLVFDNERVLHGRHGEADPERYLQGCYLDRDWIHGRQLT
ncbi:MAG TPA: TauD/TfdA family dioxygenase [Acidimicrobiales bacterium]|jgi:gamma-butyrobetaine dioxygenase|nr:gamma-butyrobetaine dioxygenase [Actinomycetes bacterium]MDP6286419.1 TauD/TfdA family dioxygenase [Acidimicrobiales bacterium]HCV99770.1 gamma-butyrobetaine dioxygenase [Acidimicrobiaceae bacterium]HJM74187.1 TauD/TfdA family dioxygenase [Acidimicrobiales bacterium]HJP24909.1 TauD/TfdA family dioxygenase [Acidimicrobiales bacterium]|tara:strand:- start:992 stop:2128 length:1137 start_codon:yes stop_codon:yes gene_type:complete